MSLNFGLLKTFDAKERWQQDGSSLKNISSTIVTATPYTVTAGKKLYIKSIIISFEDEGDAFDVDNGDSLDIKDNATTKLGLNFNALQQGVTQTHTFNVPLIFETNITQTQGGSTFHGDITYIGWEE